ncbi:MAG: Gfo/Idh/MocA family oxidoreductase [Verrucomicrobiales bacterium]|nr:Gfo/Idh/MocA family oxidoreductase [Verrucomicrobiales bacterium]
MINPKNTKSRRSFLKTAGTGALCAPYIGWKTTANGAAPSGNIRYAAFGTNGRAWGNIQSMAGVPNATLVAAAEVDLGRAGNVAKGFPDAKIYQDWRELLENEANNFDVAVVATPDHMHAPISMSAMQLGKHCYCEKPLTRTLHEARVLREFAAANNLTTQMGIQVGSSVGNKTGVKWLREEAIGKVKEVHSMNPKSWGSMSPLPDRVDEVPGKLNWDMWIGVSKKRPFIAREFHPSNWRKRIGFGTGTLGDMGCHIYHPWFQGLNQPVTLSVTSHGPGPVDADSWPLNGMVHHKMKGNNLSDGDFDFTWYDGNQLPPKNVYDAVGGVTKNDKGQNVSNVPRSGSVVIGTNGAMVIPHGGAGIPTIYRDGKKVEETPEKAEAGSHHKDFVAHIRGETKEKPVANWDYAGPMTEAVLLGTVAMRLPAQELKWDDAAGKFTNSEKANALVHDKYREGWDVKGI